MGFPHDTWIFPNWFKVNIPSPLSLGKSCPHLIFRCIDIVGCGFFSLIFIFTWCLQTCFSYHIKHRNQPWPPVNQTLINVKALASSSLWLFHIIFTSYTLMQMGSKLGCYMIMEIIWFFFKHMHKLNLGYVYVILPLHIMWFYLFWCKCVEYVRK